MNKGLSKERMKRVKWASHDKFCQVKMFISEDCPSQIGRKAEDHLQKTVSLYSNEMRVDNLPPGFGSKGHSSTSNQICIPQIRWNCPLMFTLKSDWQVVAGEESEERLTQNYRETRVLEALYSRVSTIPPSPRVSPEAEVCDDYDDTQTPIIPSTPIEEDNAMPTESLPCSESVECTLPIESKAIVNEKVHEIAAGVDADVIAAASAALTAMLKSNEKGSMVDTDLLIKILNEPKIIEALSNISCTSTTKMVSPIDPNHKALPELTPAMDTLFASQTIQAPTISRPNAKPYSDTSSISLSVKPVDNKSDLSRKAVPVSSSIFRSNLNPRILDLESSLPSSLVSSTRSEDQSLTRETQMFMGSLPSHSSVSIPAIKPVDNESDLSRKVVLASSSAIFGSKSNPQILELVSSQPPLLVASTRPEDQSLTSESQMSIGSLPFHSSVNTQVIKDVNYYKSLIRLHGKGGNETQEQYTQYQLSAPEPMVRKPCKFFNSSKGCRNGSSCPFEHVSLPNLRAGNLDTNRSKRLKVSTEITG